MRIKTMISQHLDFSEHLCRILLADSVPQRTEGEAVLFGGVPTTVTRILDVGTVYWRFWGC